MEDDRPFIQPSLPLLTIAYTDMSDLLKTLDPAQPVYVAPHLRTEPGVVAGQHTDHHFILVAQPDNKNRVHHCCIQVVRLVYHHGIAFVPEYAEQLGKVDVVLVEIEERLVREGFDTRRGIVVVP